MHEHVQAGTQQAFFNLSAHQAHLEAAVVLASAATTVAAATAAVAAAAIGASDTAAVVGAIAGPVRGVAALHMDSNIAEGYQNCSETAAGMGVGVQGKKGPCMQRRQAGRLNRQAGGGSNAHTYGLPTLKQAPLLPPAAPPYAPPPPCAPPQVEPPPPSAL